jgi:hypothetical protein
MSWASLQQFDHHCRTFIGIVEVMMNFYGDVKSQINPSTVMAATFSIRLASGSITLFAIFLTLSIAW